MRKESKYLKLVKTLRSVDSGRTVEYNRFSNTMRQLGLGTRIAKKMKNTIYLTWKVASFTGGHAIRRGWEQEQKKLPQ